MWLKGNDSFSWLDDAAEDRDRDGIELGIALEPCSSCGRTLSFSSGSLLSGPSREDGERLVRERSVVVA